MKVTRKFSFEAAHMLSRYNGLCSNLHGHSYKLQVSLEGDMNWTYADSDSAMVKDFTDLKREVNTHIIDLLDHALIFSSSDYRDQAENALLEWANDYHMKHVVLPNRCTAECIAEWIKTRLLHEIGGHITVKLWETANSFVEV